jgi:hypothetical protein
VVLVEELVKWIVLLLEVEQLIKVLMVVGLASQAEMITTNKVEVVVVLVQ